MQRFLILLMVGLSLWSIAQNSDSSVVFRGIQNRLYIKDLSENEIVIVSDSSILVQQKKDSIMLYVPELFPLNTLHLQVTNKQTNSIKNEIEVPVVFVPDPFISIASNDCKACSTQMFFDVKSKLLHGTIIPFEIIYYTIEINNRIAKGNGNMLNFDCFALLKQANLDDIFFVTAKVKGPDGIIREVKGQFRIG